MENSIDDRKGIEKPGDDVDFQLYLNMIKNGTITWEFFTQIMKDFVNNDLKKLKKLNFHLIEELKEHKTQEAVKVKQHFDRINELEKSNNILKMENQSLKEECHDLKRKILSFSNETQFHNDKNVDVKTEIVSDVRY